jgi:hypothetical protein
VIAVRTTPVIVCPTWCVISQGEHVADLNNQEGMVLHWSKDGDVRLGTCAFPDGALDPESPPLVFGSVSADGITLDDAERLAQALLTAVQQGRAA